MEGSPSSPAFDRLSLASSDASLPAPSPSLQPSSPARPPHLEGIDFPFGEDFYYARRQQWLAPPPPGVSPTRPTQAPLESSLTRLEGLLARENGEVSDETWANGLEAIHRGLIGGRRLARPMKLGVAVKVLKAGWLRDGTWPPGLPPVPSSPPSSATPPGPSQPTGAQASPPTNIVLPPAVTYAPSLSGSTPGSSSTPGTAGLETTPSVDGEPSLPVVDEVVIAAQEDPNLALQADDQETDEGTAAYTESDALAISKTRNE